MTGGIGCLPLLIQLPIFSALYYAIRYSPELSKATFMGISLGKSSLILAILAFLSYLAQGYLSMIGLPEEQKKTMRLMLIMSPVMILFVSKKSRHGKKQRRLRKKKPQSVMSSCNFTVTTVLA
ncbi:hypothetical protein WP50_31510 [Lactiplantibacillus plantarum]|nr:hypothetical protein WP50_31510 [Lactiplantibacillus plantarum]